MSAACTELRMGATTIMDAAEPRSRSLALEVMIVPLSPKFSWHAFHSTDVKIRSPNRTASLGGSIPLIGNPKPYVVDVQLARCVMHACGACRTGCRRDRNAASGRGQASRANALEFVVQILEAQNNFASGR